MNNSSSVLSPQYNEFLFAQICEEANGMHLSVLSALARLNLDPWEEATHLAAMPRADARRALARRALVSTLDRVSGRSWSPSEAEETAARLVRLLPEQREGETPGVGEIAGGAARNELIIGLSGYSLRWQFRSSRRTIRHRQWTRVFPHLQTAQYPNRKAVTRLSRLLFQAINPIQSPNDILTATIG